MTGSPQRSRRHFRILQRLRLGAAPLALVWLALAGGLHPAPAQESDRSQVILPPNELLRPEAVLGALTSLEVDREIEESALARDLARLARWRARRDQALDRLRQLNEQLDLQFNTAQNQQAPEEFDAVEQELREAEARLDSLSDEGRAMRVRIDERRRRMQALGERADELMALLPDDSESLTGVWDVRFIPTGEHGVLSLYQSGTLLSGEYVLGGGWHGSLQGTLVNGKVFLERIDAVKGRFADLSGRVDRNGRAMRGTWTERDLSANRPTDGSWVAEKRARNGSP